MPWREWRDFINLPEGKAYFALDPDGTQRLRCRTDPGDPGIVWVEYPCRVRPIRDPMALVETRFSFFMFIEPVRLEGKVNHATIRPWPLSQDELEAIKTASLQRSVVAWCIRQVWWLMGLLSRINARLHVLLRR